MVRSGRTISSEFAFLQTFHAWRFSEQSVLLRDLGAFRYAADIVSLECVKIISTHVYKKIYFYLRIFPGFYIFRFYFKIQNIIVLHFLQSSSRSPSVDLARTHVYNNYI